MSSPVGDRPKLQEELSEFIFAECVREPSHKDFRDLLLAASATVAAAATVAAVAAAVHLFPWDGHFHVDSFAAEDVRSTCHARS